MSFQALVGSSLAHRGMVLFVAVLLLALGLAQTTRMPVDVLPDLNRPTVSVHVEAPNLSASDADTQLAWPLANALAGLPDLVRLRSTSITGLATLQAEFAWGTDPYRNRQLVNERIDTTRAQLPRGAEPRLGPPTSLMGEILLISLRGSMRSSNGDTGLRRLRSFADWSLRPELLGVAGVSQVTVIGGEVAQWEVQPDPARLKLFNVSLASIENALRGYGQNRGGGIASVEGREHSLRGVAVPFSVDDLGEVAVDHRAAGPVWLNQVATITEGARLRRGSAGTDAAPAVILAVQKQPGADTRTVSAAVETRLAQLDAQLPAGSLRTTVFRQSDFIDASIGHVRDALFHGVLIVAIVLAVFLSGGRANLISLVAIPLSAAGAMLLLGALGMSVNTLTLGGLAIAIGELVDDAVVGVENVVRRMRETGTVSIERIVAATVEVRSGILNATLIIVAGFVPLFALGGVEGRLFGSLAAAYVAAILASLLVAVTVTPVLCYLGFGGPRPHVPQERAWLVSLKSAYGRALSKALLHGRAMLVVSMALLVLATLILLNLPRNFLPALNENTLTVNLVLRPGLALEESEIVGRAAEQLILELPEAELVGRRTGRAELDEHAEGVHYSELDIRLRDSNRSRANILADLHERLSVLPGAVSVSQPISHRIDHLLSGVRAPLAIKIFGEDPVQIEALARQVSALIAAQPGLKEARLDADGELLETRIRVDAAKAALYGLSPPRVLDTVSGLTAGTPMSTLIEPQRRIDLVLRLPASGRDPEALKNLLLDSPAGPVPLGWIASIATVPATGRIVREGGRRRVLISAFPGAGDFDDAVHTLGKQIATLSLPSGCEIRIEGQTAEASRSAMALLGLGLVSLLGITAVLTLRFRVAVPVLIVMTSIPLAWVGGALALGLTGTALSTASLVGFITLAGIAARNSILKISRYIDMSDREHIPFGDELIIRGSLDRLTSVLMTSCVAAASLIPFLAGSTVPGMEVLHPVALVVFGGLIGSTLLDSFVTPALYLRYGRSLNNPR
ncbi:MAG: efflux RND transporter permease subunit [Panacagrimonas sp.]